MSEITTPGHAFNTKGKTGRKLYTHKRWIPVQMRLVISGARGSFRRLQTERREEIEG